MTSESSPFRPGQPVPAELFVGRSNEIERLRDMVKTSVSGRLQVGFVSGERGIGKSSLAGFVRRLVEQDGEVVGCHVFLGGVEKLEQMFRKIMDGILKTSIDRPWHEQVKSFFGNRVKNVGMFGVTLELKMSEDEALQGVRYFIPAIKNLLKKFNDAGGRNTLFLILDDINGLAASKNFANWLKSTVDEIATSEEDIRLCIIIVGLDERRIELIGNQPSLGRVLTPIEIAPWDREETIEFYNEYFDKGGAEIPEDAINMMTDYTGGLPVLAHEIGDAVWKTSQTLKITLDNSAQGLFWAAQNIGVKLLEPQIFNEIRSERYRAILEKMSDIMSPANPSFKRADLKNILPENEEKVLDHFLRRMTKLGMLEQDSTVRGRYKFPNRLYALFVLIISKSKLRRRSRSI